ncbi:MAG: spore coat protein [Clostridia bacterium]|nr:spore coat protein [Clostridia bacterium]
MEVKQNVKSCDFQDKDRMMDALSSQKFLSGIYNESLNEAYHTPVKNCFSGLLNDVHRTQEELFAVMNERGWYPVEAAEEQKITAARQKFAAKG